MKKKYNKFKPIYLLIFVLTLVFGYSNSFIVNATQVNSNIEKTRTKEDVQDLNVEEYKITYNSNNEIIDTKTVEKDTMYSINLVPKLNDSQTSFLGWYLDSEFKQKADAKIKVVQDITLYARFSTTININYLIKNEDNTYIVKTLTIEKNSSLDKVKNYLPSETELDLNEGSSLNYWYDENDKDKKEFDFSTSITTDTNLIADINKVHYVKLNMNGGTFSGPTYINVLDNKTIDIKNIPTKKGYTFKNWSLDSKGSTSFDFKTPIIENTNLYAIYDIDKTTYNIAFWLEKSDNTIADIKEDTQYYDLIKNVGNLETVTGNTVTVDKNTADTYLKDLQLQGLNVLRYSDYYLSQSKEVDGEGNTTINVFYKRKLFTLYFNIDDFRMILGSMDVNGKTYKKDGGKYSFQAKYMQNIKELFPKDNDIKYPIIYKMYGWNYSNVGGEGVDSTLNRSHNPEFLDKLIVERSDVNNVTTFYLNITEIKIINENHDRNYYTEPIDTDVADDQINTTNYILNNTIKYSEPKLMHKYYIPDEIKGFTCVLNCEKTTEENSNHFFKRNRYDVVFDLNGGLINDDFKLVYSQLKYESIVDKPSTPDKDGYTFKGWFYDEQLTQEVDFTSLKMPANSLNVYAKWQANPVVINYLDTLSDKTLADKVEIAKDSKVVFPTNFIENTTTNENNDVFIGWFIKNDNTYFKVKNDMIVNSDLNLYAKWQKQTYTVKYDISDGIGDDVKDTHKYNYKTSAIIKDFKGSAKDKEEIFIGWQKDNDTNTIYYPNNILLIEDNVSFKAIFAKKDTIHTITYKANYGVNETSPIIQKIEKDTPYKMFGEIFTDKKNEMELIGWTTLENGEVEYALNQEITKSLVEDKTFYGVWKHFDITLTFEAKENGHLEFKDENKSISLAYNHKINNDDIAKLPIPIADENYIFDAWDVQLPILDDVMTKSQNYIATFKKKDQASLTFKYVDEKNVSLAKDKVVYTNYLGNDYDLRDSKDIIDIEGYKFDNSSQPLLGKLTNKENIITLTYVRSKLKVNINYIDQNTNKVLKENKSFFANFNNDYNYKNMAVKITGYKFVKADQELTGKFTENDFTINLYYEENQNIIDETSNKNSDKTNNNGVTEAEGKSKLPQTGQTLIITSAVILTIAIIAAGVKYKYKK
ncbi:InlB B-repeat-containing protein [Mycoplasma sp. P36-A1]|uniref:InlB B-repeat-containing protein n=1 Tax=Mycoplasma sp. P36-A1 TaxID=3252900 RepID=UPI003C2D0B43